MKKQLLLGIIIFAALANTSFASKELESFSAGPLLLLTEKEQNRGTIFINKKVSIYGKKSGYQFPTNIDHLTKEVIHSIQDVIRGDLTWPKSISVTVIDQDANESAYGPESKISFALARGFYSEIDLEGFVDGLPGGERKSLSTAKAFLAHEYGHLIFHENLLKAKNPFITASQDWRNINQDLEDARRTFNLPSNPLDFLGGTPDCLPTNSPPCLEISRLKEIRSKIEKNMQLAQLYSSDFNELFADIISLIYTKDPKAISEGLNFRDGWDNYPDVIYRDFTKWPDNLSEKEKNPIYVHFHLNNVRGYLWENYFKNNLQNPKYLSLLTRIIITVFDAQIRELIANPPVEINLDQLNLQIIQKIENYRFILE